MFVGNARLAEVDRLVTLFDEVRAKSAPVMVVYVASPGWGKTRIVQEFYRRLAGSQRHPRYWPAELVREADTGAASFIDVTTSRKAVRTASSTSPSAPPSRGCGSPRPRPRLGDGSCAPALDHVAAQVAHHLPALVGEPAPSGLVDAMAVVLPVHDVLDCAPRPRSTPRRRHLVWAYRRLGLDHEADATARRYGLDLRKV